MRRIKLTKRKAQAMLGNAANNRSIRQGTVAKYAADMLAGRWTLTGVMYVDREGRLMDGQHRCLAVIESGVTIEVIVVTTDADEFKHIDTVDPRSPQQMLEMAGYEYPSRLATAVQAAYSFEYVHMNGLWSSKYPGGGGRTASMDERFDMLVMHPLLEEDSTAMAKMMTKPTAPISYGVLASMRNIARELGAHEDFDKFAYAVGYGENIASGEPAFTLRRRLLASKNTAGQAMTMVAKAGAWCRAWNAHVDGEELTRIHVAGGFPPPYGLTEWSVMS